METKLYGIMMKLILESGLSKRGFAEKYNISRNWLIEFLNPDKPFRPMKMKTMSALYTTFNIPYDVLYEYNKMIVEERTK